MRPAAIHCPECGRLVYDGEAIKGVSVILLDPVPKGKCKLCKTWVRLPIRRAA